MRFLPLVLALAFVGVIHTPDAAAKPRLSDTDRREAKRLFDQGHLEYRRGNYEAAILRWQESYEISKQPLIFESIAAAYERLGELSSAVDYLTKWRSKAPRREHEELDNRLEQLQRRLEQARVKDEEKRKAEEEARKREAALNPPPPQPNAPGDSSIETLDIVGWSLVGVGGAALVAGLVMDGVAAGTRPNENDACTQSDSQLLCRESLSADIENSNTLAIAGDVTWILGAAMAAGGAALLIVQATSADEPEGGNQAADGSDTDSDVSWLLAPYAAPSGGGGVLRLSF